MPHRDGALGLILTVVAWGVFLGCMAGAIWWFWDSPAADLVLNPRFWRVDTRYSYYKRQLLVDMVVLTGLLTPMVISLLWIVPSLAQGIRRLDQNSARNK